MRKITTLILAVAMAVAALAPAAFANNKHCSTKDFAPIMKVEARDNAKGKDKIASAYAECNAPIDGGGGGFGLGF